MPAGANGNGRRPYLIDSILPANETSLLGGPSGAGKTRWLFDTLLHWQEGQPVLGFKSHPVPWCYVAADRSRAATNETLGGMGIDPTRVNLIPAWDKSMEINGILDAIERSGCQLAVWESFGGFVDPPGNSKCVKQMLRRTWRLNQSGITIIGVMESPKQKPYERYENPRQRISGAAAWAHFTETIFLLEPSDVKDISDPHRILYVAPRNAQGIEQGFIFDHNGRLIETDYIHRTEGDKRR